MKDRVPGYPGRTKMTRADGSVEHVTLERADLPQVVGDALNKANLLPDSVASVLGLTMSNPQVKDALSTLAVRAALKTGSYVGTGAATRSLVFDKTPKLLFLFSGAKPVQPTLVDSGSYGAGFFIQLVYPATEYYVFDWEARSYIAKVVWGTTVKLSNVKSSAAGAWNVAGETYYYQALL